MAVEARRYRPGRLTAAAADGLSGSPALPAALMAVVAFVVLAGSEGGYYPTAWYAAGLFLLALLGLTIAVLGVSRPPRATLVGLACFAGFTAWSFLSIAWSDQDGVALEGAGRPLVYLLALALFALWPVDGRGMRAVLACFGLAIAAIGVVELVRADAAAEPLGYFDDIRFAEPVGYMNGNVGMWTMALLACLSTAAAREVWPVLRALALGGASVLGALSLMGQSRGWALALPLALLAFVVLGPGRPRKLLVVALVGLACALTSGAVLGLHDDFDAARFGDQLSDAVRAVLLAGAAVTLVGLGLALLDRRLPARPPPPLAARRRVGAAVTALAALLVAGLFLAGDAGGRLSDAWDSFKSGEAHPEEGASRFSNAGTNRYDVWKVAWAVFEDHPLEGVGADGFQPEYLRQGESGEQPRFAHSLELGALAQTGLVGAGLLSAGLGALLWSALTAVGRAGREAAAAAGAAVAIFVYWLAHGSVDWFFELPGLAAPALALLGMAAAARPDAAGRRRRLAGPLALGTAAVGVLVAASLALPWLAEREISRAADRWRDDPDAALSGLDRAGSLNPVSARPALAAGTIAIRVDDLDRAEDEFREAVAREAGNSYALFELGLLASARGAQREAVALLRRALALSPRDDITRGALRVARHGRRLDPAAVNRRILERAQQRNSDAHQP